MKLRIMSDLHLEFDRRHGSKPFNVPYGEHDGNTVLVLAGDIDVDMRAIETALRAAPRFHSVIQVLGNHEYYRNGSPARLPDKLRQCITDARNVHILENGSVDVAGVRFLGATLWSDFNDNDLGALTDAGSQLNDFKRIRFGPRASPYQRRFRPSDARDLHHRWRSFIFENIVHAHADNRIPVVVTHDAPYLPEGPTGSPLSFAFGSNLDLISNEPQQSG